MIVIPEYETYAVLMGKIHSKLRRCAADSRPGELYEIEYRAKNRARKSPMAEHSMEAWIKIRREIIPLLSKSLLRSKDHR